MVNFMKIVSFFGSGPLLALLCATYYYLTPNRIRAISFLSFMIMIIYLNSFLKNIYFDSRPFMSFPDVIGFQCQSEFGNPSGNPLIQATRLPPRVFMSLYITKIFIKR